RRVVGRRSARGGIGDEQAAIRRGGNGNRNGSRRRPASAFERAALLAGETRRTSADQSRERKRQLHSGVRQLTGRGCDRGGGNRPARVAGDPAPCPSSQGSQ